MGMKRQDLKNKRKKRKVMTKKRKKEKRSIEGGLKIWLENRILGLEQKICWFAGVDSRATTSWWRMATLTWAGTQWRGKGSSTFYVSASGSTVSCWKFGI